MSLNRRLMVSIKHAKAIVQFNHSFWPRLQALRADETLGSVMDITHQDDESNETFFSSSSKNN